MEKLNEYLKTLVNTCSYELHLEPNSAPYLVSSSGNNELSPAPLTGPQISTMVFPVIPADIKQELPSKPEVEFVHPHNLGNFSFLVKKSPSGFVVIVRPLVTDLPATASEASVSAPAQVESAPAIPAPSQPVIEPQPFQTESSAATVISQPTSDGFAAPPINYDAFSYDNVDAMPDVDVEFVDTPGNDPAPSVPEFKPTYSSPALEITPEVAPAPKPAPVIEQTFVPQPPPVSVAPEPMPAPVLQSYSAPVAPPSVPIAAEPAFAAAAANPKAKARMDELFHKMAEIGASDLHMSVGAPPMVRRDGKIEVVESNETTMTAATMKELLTSIMPAKNQEEFERRHDTDFAYEIPGLARFRANIFMDRKGMGGVFRIIPTKILTAEQLGLSQAIMDLCRLSKGLVVVTGPTGSGKSTTLCAMVDSINRSREDHIITIEDPIEFVHENQQCLVNQREVHNHTDSFKDALRAALREDPDILLVGEMRDLETISIAIETAETGHLVFGTLHTTTAASTVDRIIDQFPADRQQQIRVMLSESLRGVIAQTLLPKKGGGRVAALEVLIVTPAISNLIREGKTFQIPSAMQTGKNNGMVMLNDALMDLVQKGLVEPRDAYIKAVDKTGFESLLTRNGHKL